MDETDVKILRKLTSDARASYRKIAESIGVSPPTVLSRVQNLEKDGIIKSYAALPDHERLGYDLTAVIEITAAKGKIMEIQKQIAKIPNVCAVYDISELIDMIIIAKFKNRRHLSNFVKRDLSFPYVERTNTHIALITIKEDFRFVD